MVHESGRVVYSKNADQKSLIASTTKIMTAILAIENCRMQDEVLIEDEYCRCEGSSMYLKAGDEYTVEELLKGLLLVSGNDAALALACHTSGSVSEFVKLMNHKASELGMKNTHFENPHGLDGSKHYSTAADMAALMLYCMQNPVFREITSIRSTVIGEQTLINHNRLLRLCKGCIGGKTGYTEAAGRCLVSCCERDDCMYVCVSLNAPDDWNDHIKLYNWAYSRYRERDAAENISFEVPVISGKEKNVRVEAQKCTVLLPKDAVISVRAELPFFEFAPIEAGESAGWAQVYYNGEKIAETELYYRDSVEASA